ncbi:MAG: hypothetical protein ACRY3E_02950 [Candidatus Lariskella arthropodorum]
MSTNTYTQLHKSQTKMIAADFLRNLIKALPDKIHKVLTDNGIQFNASCQLIDYCMVDF